MSHPHDNPARENEQPNDVLEHAVSALRAQTVPEAPPPRVVASTVEKLRALDGGLKPRRFTSLAKLPRYAAAAAVLLTALAGVLWLMDRQASFSFAQVVDQVSGAKAVSFVVKQRIGARPELEAKFSIHGEILRYEVPEMLVLILDTARREGLELDVQRKIAKKIDLQGRVPAEDLQEPIERLRSLKDSVKDHVTQLADEKLDGRSCHVFEVAGAKQRFALVPAQFKLWVDARTALPVKIHAEDEQTSLTYEQFRWDAPAPDALFSLAVPEGYLLEQFKPARLVPGRIHYHEGGVALRLIEPDGKSPQTEFVPRLENSPNTYVSERTELSPSGRHLAIAYTHSTKKGLFPPCRVLLWDRTQPAEPAVEVYARPEGELQFWRFSDDGRRLYVAWWQGIPDRTGPDGRYGADVVDLESKTSRTLTLPKHRGTDGKEQEMLFAAASRDGQHYLVVGDGLHVATAQGELLRRLSEPGASVVPAGVHLSPDGSQVAYVSTQSKDRSQQLHIVPFAGGAPRQLVPPGKLTELRARWSPDGKRLACTARALDPGNPPFNHGTETYLRVIDADGTGALTLRAEKVHPRGPSFELIAWR